LVRERGDAFMPEQTTLKAVFHVDEPEKLELALANVQNFLAYCAEHSLTHQTEIVLNSRAVAALKKGGDAGTEDALRSLADQGVRIAACGNALRGLGVGAESLYPFATVVPAGVAELIERQAEGYAYVKP
jgi:intracellular sulfur oxidation DsrE/DsrF family protein